MGVCGNTRMDEGSAHLIAIEEDTIVKKKILLLGAGYNCIGMCIVRWWVNSVTEKRNEIKKNK